MNGRNGCEWWLRGLVLGVCGLLAAATWCSFGKADGVGEIDLSSFARWSALGASGLLAVAAVVAVCGRKGGGLAFAGAAIGLIVSPVMGACRDAMDLARMQLESDPAAPLPNLASLWHPGIGTWCFAAGLLLWLLGLVLIRDRRGQPTPPG
jgi:hypothetical protein